MTFHDLEAPGSGKAPNWGALYRARGDEVSASRPIFTGDIFEDASCIGPQGTVKKTILILQHPCALRTNGVDLVSRLLVAEVVASDSLVPASEWKGRFKQMPLPELYAQPEGHFVAHLHEPQLVLPESLRLETRIACMSQMGVNILLQRWVHHNSRVIVPTFEYQKVTSEQFEEADLVEEWCDELAADEAEILIETRAAHDWLRSPSNIGDMSWQDLLKDPQSRSTVRVALRKQVKERLKN
ncbi:hypothetical protein [Specibacter cremeus]|uniref:hypothetical protein n=1 Tax=Specibacter cremeus TaxID=1629051 RepID=UPI000F7A8C27|nr:hypothetical protein [Specibacter cremeus]